jgi:L-ornithine N5-oxygenase
MNTVNAFAPMTMIRNETLILDVLGIGFGPSNIAIAIAQREIAPHLSAHFLERCPAFGWHDTMLFSHATMQVNFLKDLVSFRNPCSTFSFVNFLHSNNRLTDFSNLQTLFPRRVEFHQYLAWCAAQLDVGVTYGALVTGIDNITLQAETLYRVRYTTEKGATEVYARTLVYSGGLTPKIPFETCQSVRISHGYHILDTLKSHAPRAHYAVVGGGQSAAEIVQLLHEKGARVSAIVSRFGYVPADDSPFVNQLFDPDQVDPYFATTAQTRAQIYNLHATSNYAGVDLDLLKALYSNWYHGKITGDDRLTFHRMCRVTSALDTGDGVKITVQNALDAGLTDLSADYLICATGFNKRSVLDLMSEPLRAQVSTDVAGDPVFERDYALAIRGQVSNAIYAPHMTESQHGLTATLLSNMAIRSGEIVESIVARLKNSGRAAHQRELVGG